MKIIWRFNKNFKGSDNWYPYEITVLLFTTLTFLAFPPPAVACSSRRPTAGTDEETVLRDDSSAECRATSSGTPHESAETSKRQTFRAILYSIKKPNCHLPSRTWRAYRRSDGGSSGSKSLTRPRRPPWTWYNWNRFLKWEVKKKRHQSDPNSITHSRTKTSQQASGIQSIYLTTPGPF